jgi:hypothetical protein
MSAEQAERPVVVTEQDRAQAAEGVNRNARGAIVGGLAMVGVTNLFAGQVLDAILPNLRGAVRVLALAGVSTTRGSARTSSPTSTTTCRQSGSRS